MKPGVLNFDRIQGLSLNTQLSHSVLAPSYFPGLPKLPPAAHRCHIASMQARHKQVLDWKSTRTYENLSRINLPCRIGVFPLHLAACRNARDKRQLCQSLEPCLETSLLKQRPRDDCDDEPSSPSSSMKYLYRMFLPCPEPELQELWQQHLAATRCRKPSVQKGRC